MIFNFNNNFLLYQLSVIKQKYGAMAQRVGHLPCMEPTWVRFLRPSRRAWQATESTPPARQSLASSPWHIRYAKNSNNKSHSGDGTGARSSRSMNNRTTVFTVLKLIKNIPVDSILISISFDKYFWKTIWQYVLEN